MSQKRKLIAGNWKMNGLQADGIALAKALAAEASYPAEIVLCPPATLLSAIAAITAKTDIRLGGQDCHPAEKGAHTGDISAEMLRDQGASYVIVGHSERRAGHHEASSLVAQKANAAIRAGLIPIICVGETLETRDAGHAESKVSAELLVSLPDSAGFVIAYEPIWAIGTGRSCHINDIQAMHRALLLALRECDPSLANTRILYGGSVKADNAAEILALPEVDGALVGGASLDAAGFLKIIHSVPQNAVGSLVRAG